MINEYINRVQKRMKGNGVKQEINTDLINILIPAITSIFSCFSGDREEALKLSKTRIGEARLKVTIRRENREKGVRMRPSEMRETVKAMIVELENSTDEEFEQAKEELRID